MFATQLRCSSQKKERRTTAHNWPLGEMPNKIFYIFDDVLGTSPSGLTLDVQLYGSRSVKCSFFGNTLWLQKIAYTEHKNFRKKFGLSLFDQDRERHSFKRFCIVKEAWRSSSKKQTSQEFFYGTLCSVYHIYALHKAHASKKLLSPRMLYWQNSFF